MAKQPRKNMTEKQLANLTGVKKRKPKASPITEPKLNEVEKTRSDWERNHAIIINEYIRLLGQKQKIPSFSDIGKNLGFCEMTIRRHIEEYSTEDFLSKLKIGNEMVLLNVLYQAATGKNVKIMELFLRCTNVLKTKVDITTGGNPLPATHGKFVTLDPTNLPTDILKAIIEQDADTNNV